MMQQEWQVEGRAYLSMIALQFGPEYCNTGILNKRDKVIIQEGLNILSDQDHALWAGVSGTPTRLPRGCKTFLLELFCGAMVLSTMAAQGGLPISQPTDEIYDGINLMTKVGRDAVDAQIERDDPWLTTYSFRAGHGTLGRSLT